LLLVTLRIQAPVIDLYGYIPDFLSTSFAVFHTTILPYDGVVRQCRLFRQEAPLVSRHASRQVFRRTTGQEQIDIFPVTIRGLRPRMSRWLDGLALPSI
jgi:hypothetical protein